MNPVSTIPFHLARAYGIERTQAPQPAASPKRPITPIAPVRTSALRLFHPQGGTKANPGVANLIAARVPGGVDFSADGPQPRAGSLALYHHPAERNAAATGVDLGRMLDTTA